MLSTVNDSTINVSANIIINNISVVVIMNGRITKSVGCGQMRSTLIGYLLL